jgi:hypothetical protein
VHGTAEELGRFAVQSTGSIHVSTGPGYWHVHLRPDLLTPQSLEQLSILLLGGAPPRIAIEQVADVAARIRAIAEDPRRAVFAGGFSAYEMSLEEIARMRRPLIATAYRSWQARRGRLSRRVVRDLLDRPIGTPGLLVRMGRDREPITETLPPYVNFWGDTDLRTLIGRPVADHPDPAYAAAVARGFIDIDRRERPHLELVDAVVRAPDGGTQRLRYDRLILPWRGVDGTRFVSSSSFARVIRGAASA